MKKFAHLMTVGAFFVASFVLVAGEALATTPTVANNGSTPVTLNIKLPNGQRQFPTVEPGQTFSVPEGVTKVGFLTGADNVTVTRQDGSTVNHRGGNRPSTTSVEPQAGNPVVRTNGGVNVLPEASQDTVNAPNVGNSDIGVGGPPTPTDGPVTYPGNPLGASEERLEEIFKEIDNADNLSDIVKIQDKLGLNNDEMGALLIMYDIATYGDYWSGSGGTFGDCLGTGCQIGINVPGHPTGGPPVGSWVHFGPSRISTIRDSNLETQFLSGGINDSNFQSSFNDLFGANAVIDYDDSAF